MKPSDLFFDFREALSICDGCADSPAPEMRTSKDWAYCPTSFDLIANVPGSVEVIDGRVFCKRKAKLYRIEAAKLKAMR